MIAGPKAWVLIVVDHPIFREGLVQLINRQRDLTVCGEATDELEALAAAAELAPDIALLDLTLKGIGGLALLKRLKALHPKLPILILTMNDEAQYAERAQRAGASVVAQFGARIVGRLCETPCRLTETAYKSPAN